MTQLTDRVTTTERQLKEAREEANRSKREATNLRNTLTQNKHLIQDLRAGQATYRSMQKVIRVRDNALVEVTQLKQRLERAAQRVKTVTNESKETSNELERMKKSRHMEIQSLREAQKMAEESSRKLRQFERASKSPSHKWSAVAIALGMDDADRKRIRKAATHMHDTKSADWDESLTKKTEMVTRLPSAVWLLLQYLFSCVRVKKTSVPVEDIVRFVFPNKNNNYTALGQIRKAVQAAVSERRMSDAKMLLTLSLSSFKKGHGQVQAMKRYFTNIQPVLVGSKVTFLSQKDNSPLKKDRKIACRNYSYSSKSVSRGTVVSMSADRTQIRVEHYLPGHDKPTTTKLPATEAHNSANVYVNEELLNAAKQYEKYLGAGIPPVESPSVENHVISLAVLKHFIQWIFSPLRTNVLKARGHDGERGCTHQLKDYAARTWKAYREQAKGQGLKGISRGNNYHHMNLCKQYYI